MPEVRSGSISLNDVATKFRVKVTTSVAISECHLLIWILYLANQTVRITGHRITANPILIHPVSDIIRAIIIGVECH